VAGGCRNGADAETRKARAATSDEIRTYIASFDGHDRHLLGIFQKDGGELIGIRALYIDRARKEFVVKRAGRRDAGRAARGARERDARGDVSPLLHGVGDGRRARCSVLAHNAPILKVMANGGWTQIGTSYKAATDGGEPLELREFPPVARSVGAQTTASRRPGGKHRRRRTTRPAVAPAKCVPMTSVGFAGEAGEKHRGGVLGRGLLIVIDGRSPSRGRAIWQG